MTLHQRWVRLVEDPHRGLVVSFYLGVAIALFLFPHDHRLPIWLSSALLLFPFRFLALFLARRFAWSNRWPTTFGFLLAVGTSTLLAFPSWRDLGVTVTHVALVWPVTWVVVQWRLLLEHWRGIAVAFVSTVFSLGLVRLAGPTILRHTVFADYQLTLDHTPVAKDGLNSDGVRPDSPGRPYSPDDYVILFLGDSFAEGKGLPPEQRDQTFPFVTWRRLASCYPGKSLRVVNFGWTSSSPVLQYRRLAAIGPKYHPDLVVLALDMTDFHDDIRYLIALTGDGGDFPADINIFDVLLARLGQYERIVAAKSWLRDFFSIDEGLGELPVKRFFPLWYPLKTTAPYMETTWKAIVHLSTLSRQLGADFCLVVLPRYQQYNRNECRHDWEHWQIPSYDKYILAPFEFIESRRETVDFPIFSLLPAFKTTTVFPTTFDGDAHYNINGHRVAGEAIAQFLMADRDLGTPHCPPSTGKPDAEKANDLGAFGK